MIQYKIGDATAPEGDGKKLIVHCCNDRGAWGAGFVLALSKKWSAPEHHYHDPLKWGRTALNLGDVQMVNVEDDVTVCNMIGQEGTGSRRTRDGVNIPAVRYDAFWLGLTRVSRWLDAQPERWSVHMPMMGAGLAGGAWPIIEAIVDDCLKVDVTVYVLKSQDLPR